jgi:hypothetical protein
MSGKAILGQEQPANEVLDDPHRSRIVAACAEREWTRRGFTHREGLDFEEMKPHFDALEKAKFLGVRQGMARAVRCNFYGARRAALFRDHEFEAMQLDRRQICSRTILSCFLRRFKRGWRAQSIDVRHSSHVSYRSLFVDDEGFRELSTRFEAALDHQQEVQASSLVRIGEAQEIPIPATAALFMFESPLEDVLAGGFSRLISTEQGPLSFPIRERRLLTGRTLVGLLGLCASGLRTGTLDFRSDSHVSWTPLLLDGGGFCELNHGLVLTRSSVDEVEQKSLLRIASSATTPIPITVGFVSFESPATDAPAPKKRNEPR